MPTRFQNLLEARIKELIEDRKEDLVSGRNTTDSSYQYAIGYIYGLRDVLKLCSEINKETE